MSTDEAARLHLYELARGAFDEAAADTLMNALARDPDRLATKDDLASLGTGLGAEIAMLGNELRAEIATRNSDLLRSLFFGMVASNATLVGLVFAAVRLG